MNSWFGGWRGRRRNCRWKGVGENGSTSRRRSESAVVIAPKTLEDVVGEAAFLTGAVGELVAGKVVDADGDEDILVDVEGSGEALYENVSDVVVGVCAVVKFCAKRGLPLLGRNVAVRIRRVKNKAFELEFADAADCGTDFESSVGESFIRIGALDKADFGIEIRAYATALGDGVEPI